MDYKATLNLPRTDFPMKANLPQREPETIASWEREGLYQRIQEAGSGRPLYILHDGPPYANGRIHIGHALNKILKDIIVKCRTMAGYRVPYVPGWDCHGLPIEHQVLKELGSKKKDLDTPAIRRACRDYAEKYFRLQRDEFRRLGVLGDWEHPYLTMQPAYEATILREFGKFVAKGGVYKGLKPVLWCTTDQTALAEAEVEYEDHTSPSIYVAFPVQTVQPGGLGFDLPKQATLAVAIWTTTPWTLPANQALCLHPDLDYAFVQTEQEILVIAEKLVDTVAKACGLSNVRVLGVQKGQAIFDKGWRCTRPLSEGLSPVLLGKFVTLDQGTGCVHIAPGHGQEDYALALEHNAAASPETRLEILAPVDDNGCFREPVVEFAGQHVLKANPAIVDRLKVRGRLLGQTSIKHSYPHCWRCKNPVIFRATEQWFVSMETNHLRQDALEEIDRVRWIPPWGRDRIQGMISNRPDWCLSRQRSWGTPIPAFTCASCHALIKDQAVINHVANLVAQHGADLWFQKPAADLVPAGLRCPACNGTTFEKERDILDVWFESGVSHAAVLRPRADTVEKSWWPADLYLEGSDQHRGWFHSSLLTSVTTDKRAPYKAVLTHGFVVDGNGIKMSKAKGNVVAPADVIKQSGAEILRLWVAAQDYREDLRISPEILGHLVEAYRKIRNTCRFLLSNLYDFDAARHRVPYERLPELDRWALVRLGQLIPRVGRAYEEFEFHTIFHALNNFCSVDMSAVYLDILKDRLYTFHNDDPLRRGSQTVLSEILTALTKLMAPILSFTADEMWRMLPEPARQSAEAFSVHLVRFPEPNPRWQDAELAHRWEQLLSIRTVVQAALEGQRRAKVIRSSLEAKVALKAEPKVYDLLRRYETELPALFIVSQVSVDPVERVGEQGHVIGDATQGVTVEVGVAEGTKCERCWNYRSSVGASQEHPMLCHRCVDVIR